MNHVSQKLSVLEKFGYSLGDFPVAEKLSFETVVIPFYPQMQVDEVDQVVQAVKAALAELLPVRL